MFIKLTASDGDAIFLRPDSIVFMYRQSDNLTHIQIDKSSNAGGLGVTETPEQIMEIIKNA